MHTLNLITNNFSFSCTKKQLITSGVATGTGLGSYQNFKSFMGQSGTGGDMKTIIAVTTIGTVMGALLGSEIADNIIEHDNNYSENNELAFEDDLRQVWRQNNQEILITLNNQLMFQICHPTIVEDLNLHLKSKGQSKEGVVLLVNANKNWRMLGSEML